MNEEVQKRIEEQLGNLKEDVGVHGRILLQCVVMKRGVTMKAGPSVRNRVRWRTVLNT